MITPDLVALRLIIFWLLKSNVKLQYCVNVRCCRMAPYGLQMLQYGTAYTKMNNLLQLTLACRFQEHSERFLSNNL